MRLTVTLALSVALALPGCMTQWGDGEPPESAVDDLFGGGGDLFGSGDDSNDDGVRAPGSTWTGVGASENHSCAMNELGGVRCWGSDFWGESALPAGTYDDFSVGNDVTCGLTDGQLVCVGDQDLLPPPGEYMDVGAGRRYAACALEADGSAVCWGFCNYGICADAPDGPFVEIATGEDHACALAADGAVTCWGSDLDDELDVPAGAFTQIDAGAAHTCGVRQDGSVACWGANPSGQSDPPEGTFNDVAAGWHHSCGVKDDGEIACWGRDEAGKFPAGNGWAAVAAGENHSCAVALDGSVSCWGADEAGQSTPPAL